jgi:hypothetical protein
VEFHWTPLHWTVITLDLERKTTFSSVGSGVCGTFQRVSILRPAIARDRSRVIEQKTLDIGQISREIVQMSRDIGRKPSDIGQISRDIGQIPSDIEQISSEIKQRTLDLVTLSSDIATETLAISLFSRVHWTTSSGKLLRRPDYAGNACGHFSFSDDITADPVN